MRKVAPLLGFPGRKLTGTTIKENLTNVDIQLQTLLAIEDTFDVDIVFPFMDLSVEAEALGLKIDFPQDESPSVTEHPLKNISMLQQFEKKDFTEMFRRSRMRLFSEVVRKFRRHSYKPIGAYLIGPFTLTGMLMDINLAAVSLITNPEFVRRVTEFSTNFVINYARKLEQSGADYLILLEPSAVILSPEHFRGFVSPFLEEIGNKIQEPIVLHICGNTTHLFPEMANLKHTWGLSLDSDIEPLHAWKTTKKVIIGNINPMMVANSSSEQITAAVHDLHSKMNGIDDFILSTGCDLPPETPLANISAFMQAAKSSQSIATVTACGFTRSPFQAVAGESC